MDLKEKILEAKQKMGIKAALLIANHFKIDQFDEKKLKGCCPFHHENTPSFIWNPKTSSFYCFGCGRAFGIIDLYMAQGMNYIDAVKKLFQETETEFEDLHTKNNNDIFKNYIYPKEETNKDRSKVEDYLGKRGISKQTLDYADIKQDTHGNIVFEHRDNNGKLLCTKYRPSQPVKKGQSKMWWQKNASTCPILYGIDKIDITSPLLIVEGHVDRLSCIEAGFMNTVSIPHGAEDLNWVDFNWDILENFDTIILWSDNDDPGKKLIKEAIPRLGEYRCKVVSPDKAVEDAVLKFYEQYKLTINKTDANNVLLACGKQEILNLISNAKEVEDDEIKDLMSFKYFSIQDREKYSTGLEALDKVIHGHLLRCLTLYTGYTGAGKTTAINQIALRSFLETNEKVFVFSGEMGGDKLMSWLLDSLAGENHVIEWDNGADKPKGYSVTKQAIEVMQKFYTGNIKYYDKKGVVTTQALFDKMEYCRRRYGVKHFFIDNLMCLITKGDDEDKWQSQIDFIIRLSDFVENKNVGVHLVAHPKKPNGMAVQTIYDISGVSELANACNRAFWVKKVNDKNLAHQSEIIVLKDRETGAEGKTAKLFYDIRTRRLYSNEKELHMQCNWELNNTINYPKNVQDRLVCNIVKKEQKEVFG